MTKYLTFIGLFIFVFFVGGYPASAAETKEYTIVTAEPLKSAGVSGSVAKEKKTASISNLLDPTEKTSHEITVYTIFSNAYKGIVHLQAYRKDGKETARSIPQHISGKNGEAKQITFEFPKDMDTHEVTRLLMIDEKGMGKTTKEQTFGQEAKDIINELLQ